MKEQMRRRERRRKRKNVPFLRTRSFEKAALGFPKASGVCEELEVQSSLGSSCVRELLERENGGEGPGSLADGSDGRLLKASRAIT